MGIFHSLFDPKETPQVHKGGEVKCVILLLGTGNSGKTTTFFQFCKLKGIKPKEGNARKVMDCVLNMVLNSCEVLIKHGKLDQETISLYENLQKKRFERLDNCLITEFMEIVIDINKNPLIRECYLLYPSELSSTKEDSD